MTGPESSSEATAEFETGLTRRGLLANGGRFAMAAAGASFLAPLLAACGSSGGSSGSGSGGSAADNAVADALKGILPLPTGKNSGKGVSLTIGVANAFSGPYAANGNDAYRAQKLAVAQIAAAGGPTIKLKAVDTQGNPANAPTYMRQFGLNGTPLMLTAAAGNGFAEFPFYSQYKMLAIDASGATKQGEGKPFYYMARAQVPDQILPTILQYVKQKMPDLKHWALISDDYGSQSDKMGETTQTALFAQFGFEKPTFVYQPIGSTDYSTALSKIRASNCDAVLQFEFGTPVALFMKQYATSGIGKPVFAMDYSDQLATVAGTAFKDMYFCFDYFNVATPPNAWAKYFVDAFQKEYNYVPSYYCANGYESTFLVWQLISRVIAAGNDPKKQGDSYVKAISQAPSTFWSVYGDSGNAKYGNLSIDPTTHALSSRPIALLQASGSTTTPAKLLATSDVAGKDMKVLA